jgi:hypothetical protein
MSTRSASVIRCDHPKCSAMVEVKGYGIDWMNRDELSQAIPPVYSEWLARAALDLP